MRRRILGVLAIAALAAFGCGSTETPEEFAADVQEIQRKALEEAARIQKEKLMAGAPPPEEWRQELSKGIDEVESLQGLWIRTLEAVQAAHTDQWEKRYARDAVTMARMRTKSALKNLRGSLERAKDIQLRGVDNFVKSQKAQMRAEIAKCGNRQRGSPETGRTLKQASAKGISSGKVRYRYSFSGQVPERHQDFTEDNLRAYEQRGPR